MFEEIFNKILAMFKPADQHLIESSREEPRDLLPLNIIRTETVLSRLPIHNLSKKGKVNIHITRQNEHGEIELLWKVDPNPGYGEPRQLAYKLDTIVINRRIDDLNRPLPRIVRLGSLRDSAKELRLSSWKTDTNKIKRALHQNAGTYITAKLKYKDKEGNERDLEAGFTRYSVIFTGQKMPDGKKADAVYLILNDPYREVLNNAPVRPLDYEYLKELTPASQRFYEIISYRIFATLKFKHLYAKLLYSDYCTFSAQKRHFDYENFRVQMYKIHKPHLRSGYIKEKPTYQSITDSKGNLDWWIHYTPGPKAIAEYKTFNRKNLIADDSNHEPEPNGVGTKQPSRSKTSQRKPRATEHTHLDQDKSTASGFSALHLVHYFHTQLGRTNYHPQSSNKELALADDLLANFGPEQSRFIVDFSVDAAKSTNFQMRTLGALGQYVGEALETWRQRQQAKADREQRDADEAARRRAEQAQDQQRTARLAALKEASPQAFQAIFNTEKAKFLKWLPSAGKWDDQSFEQAMRDNLLRALEQQDHHTANER